MNSYNLFFDLIKIGVGTKKNFTRLPNEDEWYCLFDVAERHSLIGVCFSAVNLLCRPEDDYFAGMSEDLFFDWLNAAAMIQQKNEILIRQNVQLQKQLSEDGIRTSILKGVSIAALYGELSLFRQSGDIDIWVDCGMKQALRYAESLIGKPCRFDYKNLHLPLFTDVDVEMHYRVDVLMNPWYHHRLQQFWKENIKDIQGGRFITTEGETLIVPTNRLNAFYILLHCYRHLFENGIGLRQVMDYYFVLMQPLTDADRRFAQDAVDRFGIKRFASGMMGLLGRAFGLPEERMLWAPDHEEGDFLLKEIMRNGNFGHHDVRVKVVSRNRRIQHLATMIQHNWHLISHYPSEFFWGPIWLVWHWVWKRTRRS